MNSRCIGESPLELGGEVRWGRVGDDELAEVGGGGGEGGGVGGVKSRCIGESLLGGKGRWGREVGLGAEEPGW